MSDNPTLRAYADFIKTRGTEVEVDDDGFIDFELNSNSYTLSVEQDEDGREYTSVICEIMELAEEGTALAMCAANVVNAEIACAKVFLTEEGTVTVSVEMVLAAPGGMPGIFDPMMDALDSAAESFLTTFDAFNTDGGEEAGE